MKTKFWVKPKHKKSIFKRVSTYVILATLVSAAVVIRKSFYGG